MKSGTKLVCGILMAVGLLAACDGSTGGGSLMERCEAWCERRNMDPECGAEINCASCASIILSAGDRCEAEVEALFACFEGEDDLCTATGMACMAENNALTMCTNAPMVDAGP